MNWALTGNHRQRKFHDRVYLHRNIHLLNDFVFTVNEKQVKEDAALTVPLVDPLQKKGWNDNNCVHTEQGVHKGLRDRQAWEAKIKQPWDRDGSVVCHINSAIPNEKGRHNSTVIVPETEYLFSPK